MKKLLFIPSAFFLLILFNSTNSFCQEWAPIGAEWYYNASVDAPSYSEYIHYISTKDTTFAGQNCRKIDGKWYRFRNAEVVKLTPEFTYKNADTAYYFNRAYNKFVPLYVFNVTAGDTFTFYYPWKPSPFSNDSTYKIVIDSVKNININSLPLKEVFISTFIDSIAGSAHGTYIEGIGSTYMFNRQIEWPHTANTVDFLRCYNDNIISIKFQTVACEYRETTGIEEENLLYGINFYPNPASIKLTFTNLPTDFMSYEIYNQLGQKIMTNNFSSAHEEINIQNLQKGIYFINITSNIQSQTFKFIKN